MKTEIAGDAPLGLAMAPEGPRSQLGAGGGHLIEILDVAPIPNDGALGGQSVETPQSGDGVTNHVLRVAGWVHSAPLPVVRIHVISDDRTLCVVPMRFARPDVSAHYEISDDLLVGFAGEFSLLGVPTRFELQLTAELEDGVLIPFAAIGGRRRPLQPSFRGSLRPMFVTNIGRCGSTVLMNLLRCHPRIVVHDLYPYETRALGYWMHMLKVLSEPADHARSANPNSYEDDPYWVGRHPHNMRPVVEPEPIRSWLRRDHVDQLAAFCQASAEGFYRAVAEAQGIDEPAYFAEKRNPRGTARLTSELYPDARELFLVRDPRDVVCSMLSFYEKTALVSFGRDQAGTDAEFVVDIARALRDLVRQIEERRGQSLVVRYEDLIASPGGQLERILEYLELPTRPEVRVRILDQALRDTSDSRRHRTTADPGSSVGRWRTDLSASLQAACAEAFGDVVEALGYSL